MISPCSSKIALEAGKPSFSLYPYLYLTYTNDWVASRQALKKYVQNNNPINITSQSQFDTQFNRALRNGVEKEEFLQPKGWS